MRGNNDKPVKKLPIGGLDTDTSLQLVDPIDYVDAKNLQNINKDTNNEDIEIQALKGDIEAFKINDLAVQSKQIAILLKETDLPTNPDFTAGDITTIKVYTQTGYEISSTTLDTTMADAAAYAAAIQASLIAAGQTTATVTVETLSGDTYVYALVIQIDIDIPFEDFTIQSIEAAPNNVVFEYITKQESINQLLAGKFHCIGSDNLEQDLFIYATPVTTKDFTIYNIVVVTNVVDSGTLSIVNVETDGAHYFTTGDSVIISNNGGLADGIWQVYVVDPHNLYLYNSQYGIFSAGATGTISKYIEGYGAIFYANRDKYTNWLESETSTDATAIKLIGAKGLDFITTHQIDSVVKKNNYQTKFKFTDNYNRPKMLLYKEVNYIENGFIYYPDYADLAIYNYSSIARQSDLITGVENIKIDVSELTTGGQVTTYNYGFCVRLSNNDGSSSQWSFQSPIISIIEQDTTINTLSNVLGFGGDVSAEFTSKAIQLYITGIPASTYNYIEIAIIFYRGGGISGIAKTNKLPLLLSAEDYTYIYNGSSADLTTISNSDLAQLSVQIKTALNIVDLDNRTILSNVSFDIDKNLEDLASAIIVAVRKKIIEKKGTLTSASPLSFGEYELVENIVNYMGYHTFDTVPLGIMFKMKNSGWTRSYFIKNVDIEAEILAGGQDYSLGGVGSTYVNYIEITNINWDYIIDGVKLRDLVEDARITRGDINSEVIASGIFNISKTVASDKRPQYTGAAIGAGSFRTVGFFYSPDFNNISATPYVRQDGDKLIVLGNANLDSNYTGSANGVVAEFDGQLSSTKQELPIDDCVSFFPTESSARSFPLTGWSVALLDADLGNIWNSCYALCVDNGGTGATSSTGFTDLGIYNAVIIRPKSQLYPIDTTLINWKPINGVVFNVETDSSGNTYDVFGGDTFTIKKYIKVRKEQVGIDALGIGYYTQSKQNTQLSKYTFPLTNLSTPPLTIASAVDNYLLLITEFLVEKYDKSYNILNLVDSVTGYSPNVSDTTGALATVYWSQQAFEDSAQNNDRIFLPLDNKALDLSYGAITHMVVANDILYTLQPNKTERQYFDNTNQLTSVTNSTILLGTGNIMGTKGDFKSNFGCVHKWGVVKCKTDGGKDLFYYPDALRKKFLRVGEDGTVVISDRWNVSTWSLRNLKYTWNHTTPADNYGIHGVYDTKNKSIIITSRCYRKEDYKWTDGATYITQKFVTNNLYYGFDGKPMLFICLQDHTASASTEPFVGADWEDYWELVDSDSNYYNWWSIVISEKENKFKWLQTPKPKIWFPYQETILSPNPIKTVTEPTENKIHEFTETGEQCAWYCYMLGTTKNANVVGNLVAFYIGTPPFISPTSIYSIFPDFSTWGDMEVSIYDGTNYFQIIGLNAAGTVATVDGNPNIAIKTFSFRVCNVEDAYLTNVVNENAGIKVKFIATQYNSLVAPYRVDANTETLQTFIANSDFTGQDQYYSSSIPFDTTNNPTNNQADTSMMFGKYLKIKTTLRRRILQKISNFVVTFRALNRKM